jgi:hypothetical protein
MAHEEHVGAERFLHRADRRGLRRLAAGDEVEQPLGVALHEERRLRLFPREKADAGVRRLGDLAFARPEAERAQRFDQLPYRMRRRKFLQQKGWVKGNPIDLAQAADQPAEVPFCDLRRELNRYAPCGWERSLGCAFLPSYGRSRPV